jgi:hypothetical protein
MKPYLFDFSKMNPKSHLIGGKTATFDALCPKGKLKHGFIGS